MTLLLLINCLNTGIFSRCKNHRVPFKTDLNLHYVQLYTVFRDRFTIIHHMSKEGTKTEECDRGFYPTNR